MYKKILFAALSPYDLSHCLAPYLDFFLSQGWEVHVLTSGDFAFKGVSRLFKLPLHHNSISWKSFQAVRKIRRILQEQHYGILHTYGSEAGFCVRMAAQNVRLKDTKVIHISDGYRFLDRPKTKEEKADLFAQRLCSGVTHVLMTMNETDFFLAKHFRLSKDHLLKIPGLGITAQTSDLDRLDPDVIRRKYWIDEEDTVFLCIGDYTYHNNQLFLIENLEPILTKFKRVKVVLCGNPGPALNSCKVATSKNRLDDFITIVEDMDKRTELFAVANFLLAPSLGEGMPAHVLEAFEYAVPVLASRVKGHMDLIQDGKNGFLFDPTNSSELIGKIYSVLHDPPIAEIFVENSQSLAADYKLETVMGKLLPFYREWMAGSIAAPKPQEKKPADPESKKQPPPSGSPEPISSSSPPEGAAVQTAEAAFLQESAAVQTAEATFLQEGAAVQAAEAAFLQEGAAAQAAEAAFLQESAAVQTAEAAFLQEGAAAQAAEASFLQEGAAVQTAEAAFLQEGAAVPVFAPAPFNETTGGKPLDARPSPEAGGHPHEIAPVLPLKIKKIIPFSTEKSSPKEDSPKSFSLLQPSVFLEADPFVKGDPASQTDVPASGRESHNQIPEDPSQTDASTKEKPSGKAIFLHDEISSVQDTMERLKKYHPAFLQSDDTSSPQKE